jgi:hypothetical protein
LDQYEDYNDFIEDFLAGRRRRIVNVLFGNTQNVHHGDGDGDGAAVTPPLSGGLPHNLNNDDKVLHMVMVMG